MSAPPDVLRDYDQPTGAPFAYQRIADELAARVTDGTFGPGDRLPSIRRTAAHWKASLPTVIQAYRLLEARRLIEARPKSGYFVLAHAARPAAPPSASRPTALPTSVATADLIVRFLGAIADPRLVPLGTALPDAALLPTARLARTMGTVVRRDPVRSVMIAIPAGTVELRGEIARRSLATRAAVSADDIVVTTGCAEAIALGLRVLTSPGDTVALESPAFFGTLQVIAALGLRALEVPTDPRTGIDLDALDATLASGTVRALVLSPTVHNPLGFVMHDDGKRALASVLDRHRVPVIEDDTYAELHFGAVRPASLRAFVRTAPVLWCGSFSKTLAPAFRVGWIVPGSWRAELLRIKAATTVATAAPTELAIAEFLRTGGYDHHLRKLRRVLRENVQRVAAEVADRFPPGTRISQPAGGLLLWIELPDAVDALELTRRCLARGVSIAPGPVFSATGEYRSCIRLNAGQRWSPHIARAVQTIADEARSLARR